MIVKIVVPCAGFLLNKQVGGELLFHTLFVFFRQPGSRTEAGKGVSSAHCPTCGAPESGGTSNACEFCGSVLTDGAHGWVWQEFCSRTEARGQQLLASLHQPDRGGVSSPTGRRG